MAEGYLPKPGLNHVGNYQVSAVPFATSSVVAPINSATPLEITFPSVTKFVVIKNISDEQTRDIIKGTTG